MKIFEFIDSFIVLEGIRTVVIEPIREEFNSVIIEDDRVKNHWIMKVVYENSDTFMVNFHDKSIAREHYYRLLHELQGLHHANTAINRDNNLSAT